MGTVTLSISGSGRGSANGVTPRPPTDPATGRGTKASRTSIATAENRQPRWIHPVQEFQVGRSCGEVFYVDPAPVPVDAGLPLVPYPIEPRTLGPCSRCCWRACTAAARCTVPWTVPPARRGLQRDWVRVRTSRAVRASLLKLGGGMVRVRLEFSQ
jgi:hypothetical protein